MVVFSFGAAQALAAGQRGALQGGTAAQISSASELMDKQVQNQQGQDLGKVKDLVFTNDGRISYLIVAQGGVMGVGEKLTPIPFTNVQLDSRQDAVILSNIDKQQLENAPKISQGEWQKLSDPGFERDIFSYYGQQSDQGRMKPGMSSGATGSEQQSGAGQTQRLPGQSPMQQQTPGQSGR